MLKTFLLTDEFPPIQTGVARMMGEIAARYPRGELLVSTGQHHDAPETDGHYPGVAIDRLPIRTRSLKHLVGRLLWSRRVSSLVRQHKPRFLWCDSIRPSAYPAKWAHERHGTKYGVLVHGGDMQQELHRIHHSQLARRTARALLGSAAAVVANSQWTREQAQTVLRELGLDPLAEHVQVVPLGTDPVQFRPGLDTRDVRARYRLDGGPWVLTVARLELYKGVDTGIRAVAQLRANGVNVRYAVVGAGKKRDVFKRLADELGAADAVRFVGNVPDADLPLIYSVATAYLGASRRADGRGVEGVGVAGAPPPHGAPRYRGPKRRSGGGGPGWRNRPRGRPRRRGCGRRGAAPRAHRRSVRAPAGPGWPQVGRDAVQLGPGDPRSAGDRITTLLLAFNFPPHGGGIARMASELARRYPPQTLVVSTGTYPGSAESDARFEQPIDRLGIRATRLRTLHGLALWTWRSHALARRHRPGFVWCAELKPAGYPARWLARRPGIPYGVLVHGTELLLLDRKINRSAFKRWTASRLLGDAAVVVANSTWTAALAGTVLDALGRNPAAPPVRVVPLGTDPVHFRPGVDPRAARATYGLDGGPWLLTVSRLEWHKGIDTTIRALPAVRAAVPGARYAIAGIGPRRAELERLVGELGLGDAVRFLGAVPDADLPAVYAAADLYVGASRRHALLVEGFGISLVEASACGIAVVGGRSGGIPDAVRDGETGLLVNPDDPAAVAGGITTLLRDPERRRRMGAAGRRAVETFYNWDRVARDLIRIDEEFRLR